MISHSEPCEICGRPARVEVDDLPYCRSCEPLARAQERRRAAEWEIEHRRQEADLAARAEIAAAEAQAAAIIEERRIAAIAETRGSIARAASVRLATIERRRVAAMDAARASDPARRTPSVIWGLEEVAGGLEVEVVPEVVPEPKRRRKDGLWRVAILEIVALQDQTTEEITARLASAGMGVAPPAIRARLAALAAEDQIVRISEHPEQRWISRSHPGLSLAELAIHYARHGGVTHQQLSERTGRGYPFCASTCAQLRAAGVLRAEGAPTAGARGGRAKLTYYLGGRSR